MSSSASERYRRVAEGFTQRVVAVPDDAWENPAPCEGWVARDVVRHLVDWVPSFFFDTWDIKLPNGPTVDEDPVKAWANVNNAIQAALDDPKVANKQKTTYMGRGTFGDQIDMICTTDVFCHTWDLARAAGLDERLDPDEVHRVLISLEPADEMLRMSGQYGPRVPVPADADEQTQLIGFLGRQP